VVDAAGLERIPLPGCAQEAAVSVAYAERKDRFVPRY